MYIVGVFIYLSHSNSPSLSLFFSRLGLNATVLHKISTSYSYQYSPLTLDKNDSNTIYIYAQVSIPNHKAMALHQANL